MKSFYIYIGSNASYEFLEHSLAGYVNQGIKLRRITRQDIVERNILQENKGDIMALFLPGARSSQVYNEDLGGKGFDAIRDYVATGGSYIGICAGAYLACNHIAYDGPEISRRGKHYDLDLFDGMAVGELTALYTDETRVVNSWNSVISTPVHVTGRDHPVNMAYWRGPYYQPALGEDITVLARYYDVVLPDGNQAIAIASKKYGRGKAVFCGVHPELGGFELEKSPSAKFIDLDDGSNRLQLAKILKRAEVDRMSLFHHMVHEALDKPEQDIAPSAIYNGLLYK